MSSGLLYGLGIMSGTSLDGLDLCYVEFKKDDDSYFKILKTKTFNYNSNWKKKLCRRSKECLIYNRKNQKKF